ncbi:M15 family metallopeptidase [bacterium]|nr:M15 family metallopeptidase [bacterium]
MTPVNTQFNSALFSMNFLNTACNSGSFSSVDSSIFNFDFSNINNNNILFSQISQNSGFNFQMPVVQVPNFDLQKILNSFNFGSLLTNAGRNTTLGNVDYSKYGDANAKKLQQLTRETQIKVMQVMDYARSLGCEVSIISGKRTQAEQDALRVKYADQPGRVAPGNTSKHLTGKAVDLGFTKDGKRASHEIYAKIGQYAKSIGMRWGGDFTACREEWHFDMGA